MFLCLFLSIPLISFSIFFSLLTLPHWRSLSHFSFLVSLFLSSAHQELLQSSKFPPLFFPLSLLFYLFFFLNFPIYLIFLPQLSPSSHSISIPKPTDRETGFMKNFKIAHRQLTKTDILAFDVDFCPKPTPIDRQSPRLLILQLRLKFVSDFLGFSPLSLRIHLAVATHPLPFWKRD